MTAGSEAFKSYLLAAAGNFCFRRGRFGILDLTHRPLSSSFLGSPYRILNINHKKELLRGLWGAGALQGLFQGHGDVALKLVRREGTVVAALVVGGGVLGSLELITVVLRL